MDRDIDLFLDMMAAEKGAANHTLSAYRHDLEGLQKFLETRASAMRAAEEEDLRAYLGALNNRALAASTVAARSAAACSTTAAFGMTHSRPRHPRTEAGPEALIALDREG